MRSRTVEREGVAGSGENADRRISVSSRPTARRPVDQSRSRAATPESPRPQVQADDGGRAVRTRRPADPEAGAGDGAVAPPRVLRRTSPGVESGRAPYDASRTQRRTEVVRRDQASAPRTIEAPPAQRRVETRDYRRASDRASAFDRGTRSRGAAAGRARGAATASGGGSFLCAPARRRSRGRRPSARTRRASAPRRARVERSTPATLGAPRRKSSAPTPRGRHRERR